MPTQTKRQIFTWYSSPSFCLCYKKNDHKYHKRQISFPPSWYLQSIASKFREMNISLSEKRILKLVHPRFIETHSRPVKAAEIMRKYPRYAITRPDVFQFPWIVIKPEAILVLGKVFYLVPHCTMYKLLKNARERHQDQPFPEQYESSGRSRQSSALLDMESGDGLEQSPADAHTPHSYTNNTHSPLRSYAGSTPKHFGHRKNHEIRDRMLDSIENAGHSSPIGFLKELNQNQRKCHLESDHCSPDDSLPQRSPNCSINGNRIREDSVSGKITSCLAKQNNRRKFLDLRVTFGSPIIIPPSPRQSPNPKEGPDQSPNGKHDGFTNQSYSPHHTMSELLKSESEQDQVLSKQYPSPCQNGLSIKLKHLLHIDYTTKTYSPRVSSAGNTPKHFGHHNNHNSRMMNSPENIAQHSHIGSQNQGNQKKRSNLSELSRCFPNDTLSENRPSTSRNSTWNEEAAGVSRNGGRQIRSCVRKQNSYRKFLNLEVTFSSPIYIPTSPTKSPDVKGSPGAYAAYHIYNEFYH